jgi:hypothetical protein
MNKVEELGHWTGRRRHGVSDIQRRVKHGKHWLDEFWMLLVGILFPTTETNFSIRMKY